MEAQAKKAAIGKAALRYGLLIGVITIVLSVVFRIIDPLFQFTNIWVQLFSGILGIVLIVLFGLEIRKKVGGYWSFGEAFRGLMTMSVFILIVTIIYNFVLFKFIDPNMPAKISDASEMVMTQRLSKLGMGQDDIDKVTKTFTSGEFKAKLEPTFKNEATGFGFGLLFYVVINLIVAACIRKPAPLNVLDDAIDPTV